MELFLTDRALQGVHLTSKTRAFASQLFFSQEKNLAGILDTAVTLGIKNLLCLANPLLLRLLKKEKARWPFKLFIVVPNFQQFVRDTSHYGTEGAALRRVVKMPLRHKLRLGKIGLANISAILQKKFSVLTNLFLMAEIAQFMIRERDDSPLDIDTILIHPQITDLALALGQSELFQLFSEIAISEFHARPGAITRNFATLSDCFDRHQISIQQIVAPFNPRGYAMNPDRERCEEKLKQLETRRTAPNEFSSDRNGTPGGVVADHWNLSRALPLEEGVNYLKQLPFFGATVEMDDLLDENAARWIGTLKQV